MAKYSGLIGFKEDQKVVDGIVSSGYKEVKLKGDVLSNVRTFQESQKKYDNISIGNSLSLVASEYAFNNCSRMRYAVYAGQKWKIESIEVKRPRIIVKLGDIWNE